MDAVFFLSLSSGGQTVWIQIRRDILSGLIWVQTVYKGYQQTTKVVVSGQRVKTEQLLDTTFWLKSWLKSMSFGSNFFHLAKVLAATNSEPGLALNPISGELRTHGNFLRTAKTMIRTGDVQDAMNLDLVQTGGSF